MPLWNSRASLGAGLANVTFFVREMRWWQTESGGGFILARNDFWEIVQALIPHQHIFFSFEMEISLHTLIPLFIPGSVHSGSASWDDYG